MANILIQKPDLGLNDLVPTNMLDPREAASGSSNFLYEKGLIKTHGGFAKLGLTTTGLNSGQVITAVFSYKEIDGSDHLMASTLTKLYEYNPSTDTWDDKTNTALISDLMRPISSVGIGHNDAIGIDGGTANSYYHLIFSDGGNSDIQRWAGKYESMFYNLLGGDGYHEGTTHRALKVDSFQSRLMLLSPKEYDSDTGLWVDNNQRIRWPLVAKIQTWGGAVAGWGFADMLDTGGINLWSEKLGSQLIVYQTKGIWDCRYVGGSTVFSPVPLITNLGLLASNLVASAGNVHFFVADDFNVYAYYGGTVKQAIGTKIQSTLQEDLNTDYVYMAKIAIGKDGRRLWIFIPSGDGYYNTKAYIYDIRDDKWMIRNFDDKYDTGGITAMAIVGAQRYEVGASYNVAMHTVSPNDISQTATNEDVTVRYGDFLLDTSRTLDATGDAFDYSKGAWKNSGLDYSFAGGAFDADITHNDIMAVYDGSKATLSDADISVRYGTHFYTVQDPSLNGFRILPTKGGFGVIKVNNNVSLCSSELGFFDDDGESYNQNVSQILAKERLVIADTTGFVYQFDDDLDTMAGSLEQKTHYSPVFDGQETDKLKRFEGVFVVAKGSAVVVEYNIDDEGWFVCS